MHDRGRFLPYRQQPYWEHAHHAHPLLHLLVIALVVFLLVAAGIWLYHRFFRHAAVAPMLVPASATGAEGPLGVVQLRYARGEISRDEYRQLTVDLGGSVDEPPAPDEQA